MKKLSYLLCMAFSAILLSSCETRNTPINELTDLIETVEEKMDEFSEEEWDKISLKLEQIEEKFQKYEYTDEELAEIARLKGQLVGKMTRKALDNSSKIIEDATRQIGESMNGFLDELMGE